MNNWLLRILLLFAMTCITNAQWEILNQGNNINSVHFINESHGWITSTDGKMFLKTTDGGDSWNSIPHNKQYYIQQVNFLNETIGWGFGSIDTFAIIIKTTDGGDNWAEQKRFSSTWFSSMTIVDENNLYAVSSNKIFRSTDGGKNWSDISPKIQGYLNINSLVMYDAGNGVAVGNYYDGINQLCLIFKTTNGGTDWSQHVINKYYNISDMQLIRDGLIYFKAYGDTTFYLCKTENNFSTIQEKYNGRYWIGSYQFLDKNICYAIVYDSTSASNLMKSEDGGSSWTKLPFPNISRRLSINHIYFSSASKGIMLGGLGCIFKTNDGGYQWELIKNAYPFNSSVFIDKNFGLLAGGYSVGIHQDFPAGDIFATTDGGNTFKVLFSAPNVFNSCVKLNDSTIIASAKSIYKTTNGGKEWKEKYTNNSDPAGLPMLGPDLNLIYDLKFSNDTGFAVGRDYDSNTNTGKAIILNTTDSGETWNFVWEKKDSVNKWNYLLSVSKNQNTSWAVGAPGLVLKHNKNEGWVLLTPVTDLPLKKVFCLDDNVWISGGYSSENTIFLKSTNGGNWWTKNTTNPYVLNDMFFVNKNLGWAVGQNINYKGVLLKTTNSGDTWNPIIDDLEGSLNSIFVNGKYAWAVGGSGLLLRTSDSGITWIDDKNNIYPTEFKLEQNYPNPFNPNTVISYQLPVGSFVALKIYDVLGKEVATLVDEELPAGLHNFEFDGSELSSGVYFYKLETSQYSQSRKMLLLK